MITVFEVQSIKESEKYDFDGVLLDWILEKYPNGFDVPTQVYSGGLEPQHLIAEFGEDKEQSTDEFLRLNMHHDDVYIVMQPLGFDPISILTIIAINIATAVVNAILFSSPELPEGTRAAKTSPNNGVGPQTNVARALNRVPDIFGKDRSYPDLITPGVFEYQGHIKYIEQDFCISRGCGVIEDLRSGETPLDKISGATYEIFEPGESPSRLLKPSTSNEVKSLTLNPPNDSGVDMTNEFNVDYADDPFLQFGIISAPKSNNSDAFVWDGYSNGSLLILSDVYNTDNFPLDGQYTVFDATEADAFAAVEDYTILDGIIEIGFDASGLSQVSRVSFVGNSSQGPFIRGKLYKIVTATQSILRLEIDAPDGDGVITGTFHGQDIRLSNAAGININWLIINVFGVGYNVLTVGDRIYNPNARGPDSPKKRGPFVIPGDDNFEAWCDIEFPRGLVKNSDESVTVDIKFTFEELDENLNPTGITFEVDRSYTDDVPDQRFYTEKIDNFDGLIQGKNYQVTAERVSDTDKDDATLFDQCQWTRLAGIENIAAADGTGTTRLKVNTLATEQTSSLQESKINLNWTRKTVTWNGSSVVGDIATGAGLTASKRFADAFLHYALDPELGARSISQINADDIYEIQDFLDAIDSGEKGEFSFTFSNENTPALEELRQIANAARCILIREGSVLSCVRDQAQHFSTQLFNRRNKVPDSERKTITFNKPLDVDGVTLEYKSDVDDEIKIISIPEDLEPGDPNYGNPASLNPLKVEATGIRSLIQAWDRAQYEYNKIIYKRETVETTVTGEALLLNLNDRVDHVDGTRIQSKVSEGEVLGFSGFDVDTSEICEFEDGKTYSVIFRNIDGSLSSAFTATQRSDTDFGFTLSSSPSLFLRGSNGFQLGSLYSFASDDAASQSYLVQKITPDSDGNVTLELINYADEYYQADEEIPPGVGPAYSDGYSNGYS